MKPRDAILALLAEGPIEGRQTIYDRLYDRHREDRDFRWRTVLGEPYCREVGAELDLLVGDRFVRRPELYVLTEDGRKVLEVRDD